MDRKVWAGLVRDAVIRYRQHVAGLNGHDSDTEAWSAATIEAVSRLPLAKQIEEHIVEFGQCLEDLGRERLA